MVTLDNRHSRRVALLKVALPLIALGILSTLFLVADRRGTGERIPYSQIEIDRIIREQQISNPNYSGVTDDGSAITMAAGKIRPDPDVIGATDVSNLIGSIESPGGTRIDLSSHRARLGQDDAVSLSEDVRIRSSTGFRVTGDAMELDLRGGTLVTERPVTATGPPGRLEAGGMALSLVDGRYVMTFTDRVKLVYDPDDVVGDE